MKKLWMIGIVLLVAGCEWVQGPVIRWQFPPDFTGLVKVVEAGHGQEIQKLSDGSYLIDVPSSGLVELKSFGPLFRSGLAGRGGFSANVPIGYVDGLPEENSFYPGWGHESEAYWAFVGTHEEWMRINYDTGIAEKEFAAQVAKRTSNKSEMPTP